MMNRCISWENMIYDKCRFCNGYKTECPEYLSDIEHTRNRSGGAVTHTNEETVLRTPSESYSNSLEGDKTSKLPRLDVLSTTPPEKPFYFGHNETIHNLVLPKNKLLKLIRNGLRGIQ